MWTLLVSIFKIMLAGILGGIVGYEREATDKPAGLRTLMLVAVGSAIFTIVSVQLAGGKDYADVTRIAAQVVTGIGFLGAGAIIRDRGSVEGITTAAAIWATAAIGLLVGAGLLIEAVVATGFVYYTLHYVSNIFETKKKPKDRSGDQVYPEENPSKDADQ